MLGLALFFIWSLNTSFVLKPASLIEFERDSRLTAEPQDFCARTDLQNVYLSPEFSSHAWLFGSCRLWLMWSRILLILQEKILPPKFYRSCDYLRSIFLSEFSAHYLLKCGYCSLGYFGILKNHVRNKTFKILRKDRKKTPKYYK